MVVSYVQGLLYKARPASRAVVVVDAPQRAPRASAHSAQLTSLFSLR